MRRITLLLALVAAAAAFGAVVAPARSGGDRWTTHRVASARLRIAAPAAWIDMTRLTPQVLDRVRKLPQLAAYVSAVKTSKAVKLMLADAGPDTVSTGFATNCNVLQVPTVGDLKLQRDANLAQLESASFVVGTVHAAYRTLPAGKAVEFRYHARYTTGGRTVSLLQFILLHAGTSTVVTYTTVPGLETKELPVFLRSAASLRFSA
jgi:hypothetical protein